MTFLGRNASGVTKTPNLLFASVITCGYSRANLLSLADDYMFSKSMFATNYSNGGAELDLFINRGEGTVGGLNIYDFPNTSGDPVKILSVQGDGVFIPYQHATSGAPAYVKGGMYFDTTLNKMRIGGATGWETVTSV